MENEIKCGWMTWEDILPYKEQLIDLELDLMIRYHYPDRNIQRTYPMQKVKELEQHLLNGNTFFWGAVSDDIMIGYYWAYIVPFIDIKRWCLRSLMFRREYQGQGFGSMAIAAGFEKAKAMGCAEAVTEYVPWNVNAAKVYKKAGYEVTRMEVVKKLAESKFCGDKNAAENTGGGYCYLRLDPELCEKYHLTLAEYYYSNMTSCSSVARYTLEDAYRKISEMIAYIEEGKAFVFGCIEEEVLVGYLWGYIHQFRDEVRMYVSELHVSERWRGQGIGSELLLQIEREARNRNIEALYIHTEANNTGAVRLYERHGYQMERVQLRKSLK